MATATRNKLIPIVAFILLMAVLAIVSKSCQQSRISSANDEQDGASNNVTQDKPTETLQTLELLGAENNKSIAALQDEINRLQNLNKNQEDELQQRMDAHSAELTEQFNGVVGQLNQQIRSLQTNQRNSSANDYQIAPAPPATGRWVGDGSEFASAPPPTPVKGLNATRGQQRTAQVKRVAPVYTIAPNATLMGSTAMTALIGRVPIGGSVRDPVPFKIITGHNNMVSNGISIPEVRQAVWSGTAIGDGALKCVRGEIHSVTFTFVDGTITNVGDANSRSPIGWISDNNGYPCIKGQYVTNVPEVLANLGVAGVINGAGAALSEEQVTRTIDAGGNSSSVITGDIAQYALGRGIQAGTSQWYRYILDRYDSVYDAVVVQPGHNVAMHITTMIPVDYDTNARKVRYSSAQTTTEGLD